MEKPKAVVDKTTCLACGGCISLCPSDAIAMSINRACIDHENCISCAICIKTCPVGAINWEGT
jgi:NAD-dependent dihydropyrimidine dehydrogenase PreA subunit